MQENGCLPLRAEKIIYKILISFDISFWICDNLLSITTKTHTHTLTIFSLNSPKIIDFELFSDFDVWRESSVDITNDNFRFTCKFHSWPTTNESKTEKIYWRTTTITNWFQIQNTDSSVGQQRLHLEKRLFPTRISSRIVVYCRC